MFGSKNSSAWFGPKAAPFNTSPVPAVREGFWFRDDFQSVAQSVFGTAGTGSNNFQAAAFGSRQGIVRQSVTTTATPDRATIASFNGNGLIIGGGPLSYEAAVAEAVAQDATDRWSSRIGLGDTNAGDQVDGIWFEYDLAVNASQNWFLCTASNSVRTRTNSGIAVSGSGAFQRLHFDVNADGTNVAFYIGGVAAGQITTNIPVGSARVTGALIQRIKTLGVANARVADFDYYEISQRYTTRR